MVNISERTNRVLNVIKARYDLKDKSQAMDRMAELYEEEIMEPQFRPEYVEKIKKVEKRGKFVRFMDPER